MSNSLGAGASSGGPEGRSCELKVIINFFRIFVPVKSALVQKHFSWLPSDRRYRHCHQAFVSLAKYNDVSPQNGIQLCFCGGNLEFSSFLVFEKFCTLFCAPIQ